MGKFSEFDLTVNERILLHLRGCDRFDGAAEVSDELTQKGIAEGIGISISHVPRSIKKLIQQSLVKERKEHILGRNRRMKAYFLTETGFERARSIKNRIADQDVEVLKDGKKATVKAGKLLERASISELLTGKVASGGKGRGTSTGRIAITGHMPDSSHFLGRDRELKVMDAWFTEGTPVLVVYGSRGVGKSFLLARFASRVSSRCGVQWFDLSAVGTQAEICKALGLEASTDIDDVKEVMGGMVVIFDGYYEPDEQLVEFFTELVKDPANVKMLFGARDNTPYYSRFYDPKKDAQVSEIPLKGLTIEETHQYIGAKADGKPEGGFEEAKQIWQLTKGKPAALNALCQDDIEGLRALGLSTEESRLLLFLKGKILGSDAIE
jgi:DNA-binding MarR family transcriptional regulator